MTLISLSENLASAGTTAGSSTTAGTGAGGSALSAPGTTHAPEAPDGPEVLVLAAAPSRSAPPVPVVVAEESVLRRADGSAAVDTDVLADLLPALGFQAGQDSVARIPVSAVRPAAPGRAGSQVAGEEEADSLRTVLVVGLGSAWNQAGTSSPSNLLSRSPESRSPEDSPASARPPADDSPALGEDRPGLLRRAAGRATRALSGVRWAALALPAQGGPWLRSVCEGALLGAYTWNGAEAAEAGRGTTSGSEQEGGAPQPGGHLERVTVLSSLAPTAEGSEILDEARVVSEATDLARDLVNEPPNRLTPCTLAHRAEQLAQEGGLEIRTWDHKDLEEGGFGGLLGVGQGSANPPALVRLRWDPPGAGSHVALVGKGITFDSGGLSLKPPASMPSMKSDMAGAATVLAAVVAASRLALPVRVTAWLALAENMPGPTAQRPGDIITTVDGTTVEVTNTDAEGRLVMADALATAVAEEPDAVLDVATLTGAQVVALGDHVAGVMGTPSVREQVVTAARRAGEAFWPMPLPTSLRSDLDTPVADLRNAKVGSRAAGMITAGLFLREFVGSTPWAHLDVAGPAFNSSQPWGLTPAGGTGAGVATLIELLRLQGQEATGPHPAGTSPREPADPTRSA